MTSKGLTLPSSLRHKVLISVGVVGALIASVAFTASPAVAVDTVRAYTFTTAQTEIRIDKVTGEEFLGNVNSTHFVDEVENFTDQAESFGLAADSETQGVEKRLWLPESFPGTPEDSASAASIFRIDVDAHSSARSIADGFIPDWPGITYGFYRIAVDGITLETPELIGSFTTTGVHVAIHFFDDGEGLDARMGQPATFVGSSVFPGADTVATAQGLTPGEQLGLWLSPGIDYFSFIASGAQLADSAVYAGEGFVAPDGTLTATLAVPPNLVPGSYQLLVGNAGDRNWPAGTTEPINVVAAPQGTVVSGSAVEGPTLESAVVQRTVGSTQIVFDFGSEVTAAGVTTATVSDSGPTVNGFQFAGGSPLYYYLHTTAEFSGPVEVCFTYDVAQVGAGPVDIRHFTNGAWETLPSGPNSDTVNGVTCGMTTSFSPFALAKPAQVVLTKVQQCLNGGWAASTNPVFANQSKCLVYVALGGRTIVQVIKAIIVKIFHHRFF